MSSPCGSALDCRQPGRKIEPRSIREPVSEACTTHSPHLSQNHDFFFLDGSHDWWNCRHNVGWSLRPPLGPRGLLRHSGGVWVWPRVHSELHRIRYCEACSCSSCSGKDFWHCSYVKRASFCPNSSTTRLLVQKLDQVYNKETTKALKLWPFGFPRKGSV